MPNRKVKLLSILELKPGMLVKTKEKMGFSVSLDPFLEMNNFYITKYDEFLLVVEVESNMFYPNSWEYQEQGPFHTVKFLMSDGKFGYETVYIGDVETHTLAGHISHYKHFEYYG